MTAGRRVLASVRIPVNIFATGKELLAHIDPKKLLVVTELLEGLQGVLDAVP